MFFLQVQKSNGQLCRGFNHEFFCKDKVGHIMPPLTDIIFASRRDYKAIFAKLVIEEYC